MYKRQAKGTFYLYFHDKDQLLGQLVYNISAQVLEEAYEWPVSYTHLDVYKRQVRNWPMASRTVLLAPESCVRPALRLEAPLLSCAAPAVSCAAPSRREAALSLSGLRRSAAPVRHGLRLRRTGGVSPVR